MGLSNLGSISGRLSFSVFTTYQLIPPYLLSWLWYAGAAASMSGDRIPPRMRREVRMHAETGSRESPKIHHSVADLVVEAVTQADGYQ